jgi:16S rRNA processing protein RimM
MSDKLILIGRVAGAFGVKGEVRITAYGEDPAALLTYRDLKRRDGSPGLTVLSGRVAKGELIAKVKELDVKEAADAMRGLDLYVPREALPPTEEDEFYLTDLIGLRAETAAGEALGVVKAVPNFRAGDILEIAPPQGASFYIPFTRDAVPEVRIAEGVVIVVPPTEEAEGVAEAGKA